MSRKSWVRTGVQLRPTTVVEDSGGFGAFAPQREMTPRASFLGVYTAPSWRRSQPDTKYRGESDYVMQVGLWRAAPRPREKTPNLARFKMMAVQEPPPGRVPPGGSGYSFRPGCEIRWRPVLRIP